MRISTTDSFFSINKSAGDPAVTALAWRYGNALARRWHRSYAALPADADADSVAELTMALDAAEGLGVSDAALRGQLTAAVRRFSARAFLGFDPRRGSPPQVVVSLTHEDACMAAGIPIPADPARCPTLRRTLPDYNLWYDALITTYFGDRFGVAHGASFAQLMRWRSGLQPYPDRRQLGEDAFYDLVYLITHLVYTHNGYGQRPSDPVAMAPELAYLRGSFQQVIDDDDPETYAEYVDTLRSFGLSATDEPRIGWAMARLMALQNPDGSWGDPGERDVYSRYHSTWTAVDALREYRWERREPRR